MTRLSMKLYMLLKIVQVEDYIQAGMPLQSLVNQQTKMQSNLKPGI